MSTLNSVSSLYRGATFISDDIFSFAKYYVYAKKAAHESRAKQ